MYDINRFLKLFHLSYKLNILFAESERTTKLILRTTKSHDNNEDKIIAVWYF